MTSSLLAAVLILTLLVLVHAQQPPEGANWSRLYGDGFGSNFSPQTQITRRTIPLEIKWTFPNPRAQQIKDVVRVTDGVEHPPIVLDGIVYYVKGNEHIIALNADDGRFIWTFRPQFNPSNRPIARGLIHTHGIEIIDGIVYHLSKDCTIYGLDALTGQVRVAIGDMCDKAEGSGGPYTTSYPPTVYRKRNILIAAPSGSSYGGRGFVAGYDLKTNKEIWRWYVVPPAGYSGDWGVEEASRGNVRSIKGDWGGSRLVGGGGVWSRFSVDEESGMVYFGTGNPAPVFNATNRPGPNLFTDSIVALNANDGSLVWYYQTTTHDVSDYDCGWNTMLVKVTMGGSEKKVVIQGCKNGYVYALDAFNGKPVWEPLKLPDVARLNDLNANAGSAANMNAQYAADRVTWDRGAFTMCPGHTGAIETPNAFAYNTIFVAIKNECVRIRPIPVSIRPPTNETFAGVEQITMAASPINSTVYAIDASTGKIKWKHFIDNRVVSGGCCMVSGGVVYFGDRDGLLYALDSEDGRLLWQRRFNAIFSSPPSIGAGLDGEMMLFVPVSGGPAADIPGAIIALGLPSRAVDPVSNNMLVTILLVIVIAATIAVLGQRFRGRTANSETSKGNQAGSFWLGHSEI